MTEKPKVPDTTAKPARSAVDDWNHAVREAFIEDGDDRSARAVLEASSEEIERQLVAAGFDLAAEEAAAAATYEAMLAKLEGKPESIAEDHDNDDPKSEVAWVASTATPNVVPLNAKRSRSVWLVYAIAAAIAVGGAAYVAGHQAPPPEQPKEDEPVVTPPAPTPDPTVAPPAPAPAPERMPPKGPGTKGPH